MAEQFKLDPTTINGKYQAHAESTVQTRLENSRGDRGLSKKFKSIDEAQKIFYNAVVVLLKNLFITQRANVEVADSRFATVLLNNMSNEQLDSLSDALEDKYDEILALVKKQIDLQLDLPKNGIDLSFKKDLEKQIDEAFKTLKDKLTEIKTDGKPPKISDYKQDIKTKIDAHAKVVNDAVKTISKNFSQISTGFAKANSSLSLITNIRFSQNIENLLKPISTNTGVVTDISDYFLLNKHVKNIFKDVNAKYLSAVEYYDVSDPLEKLNEREAKQLAISRAELGTTIKQIFFTSFVVDFIMFPKRIFKKAKSLIRGIGSSISLWFGSLKWTNPIKIASFVIGLLAYRIWNFFTFRLSVYKDLAGILLTPVKRLTMMTLNFATFLAKKAVRIVSFTLSKVMSLLNKLLMPKAVLKAAVSFFRTPLGATILGFVIGKIYLFGKNLYIGIRDKFAAMVEEIEKAYDDFTTWFSETQLGKWLSGMGDAIDAAGGIFNFLEDKGQYVLEVANKIAHIDVFWILKDLVGNLKDFLGSMIGGGIGSLLGSAAGMAIGGPVGSAIGSLLGSIAGEWIGRKISEFSRGYFQKHKNQDAEFKQAISFANLGVDVERITAEYNPDSVVVHTIADQLLKKFNSMESGAEGRKSLAKQLDYVKTMEKLREEAFYSEGGKFSHFNAKYENLNKDFGNDGEKETFENKIKRIANEVETEINDIDNTELNARIKKNDVESLLKKSFVQYDFYNKDSTAVPKSNTLHPYRFRFIRALYIRDLISKYKQSKISPEQFAIIYNELSNPRSKIYSNPLYVEGGVIAYNQSLAATRDVGASNAAMSRIKDAKITGDTFFGGNMYHHEFRDKNGKITSNEFEPMFRIGASDATGLTERRYFEGANVLDDLAIQLQSESLEATNLKKLLDELVQAADLREKESELESIGISPPILKASRKRLEDYLFYLLSSVDPNLDSNEKKKEVLDFFNKTWIYHLGTLLNTGEFGDASSKTNFQTLIERQAAKHDMSAEFYEQIKSGAVTSVSQLYQTAPGKDQTPGFGTNMTIQKVEETIEQIDKAVDYVHQRYEKYTDPKNEAELHKKVDEIVNRIRNWHDRNIYPILWSGNPGWAKPSKNPTALDAQPATGL